MTTMEPAFFEIILSVSDMLASGFESRDEIGDPLDEALANSGVGEVIGGGSGLGKAHIDIEISLAISAEKAVAFLKTALREINVPRSTIILRHKPERTEYPVWE